MSFRPTSTNDFERLASLRADPTQRPAYERLRNAIATANHGLVAKIARRYGGTPDQEQAGVLGLLQALERYDPAAGKLASFAAIYIERAIRDELDARRLIRLPEAVSDDLRRVDRRPELFDATEREALAELGARQTLRLDARRLDNGETLHDRLAGPQPAVDVVCDLARLDAWLQTAVAALPPALRRLVAWRFGLPDARPRQPRHVDVDREQIFAEALGRIGVVSASELRALRRVLLAAPWRCLMTARRIALAAVQLVPAEQAA
jgi:Sigma-70 region 2